MKKDLTIYDIYALSGEDAEVFYVGMTTDLPKRYKQHLAGDDNEEKTRLIRHMQAWEEPITITRLDVAVGLEEAMQLEAFWILYYTLAGTSLTNVSPGSLMEMCWIDKAHKDKLKAVVQTWQ